MGGRCEGRRCCRHQNLGQRESHQRQSTSWLRDDKDRAFIQFFGL